MEVKKVTENKRLIKGVSGEARYLHSNEIFRKEINWNIHLPSEREFKNGYCIITDKDDTAYSIDELVELLNEFQKENEQLKQQLIDEQLRTTPITLTTNISDEDFKKFEELLKNIIGDLND